MYKRTARSIPYQKLGGIDMVKCGICGGEAPRQPCITEEGTCDLCGKKVMLADECMKKKVKE
jgi:phosphoribosylaminoimidazole (AIR) synthetase